MSSLKSKRSSRPPRPQLKEKIVMSQTSTRGDIDDKKPQVQLRGLMNNQEHLIFLRKNCNSYEKSLIETNGNKDDDVLVKHMMNLPDYLQRVDEGEYVQGKALNYGVLDWHRLEKWKGNNRVNPARSNVNSSASGSGSARLGTVQRKQVHLVKEKSLYQDVKDCSVSVKRPHFKDKSRSRSYSSVKVGMGRENLSGQKSSVNKTLAFEFSGNVLSNTTTEEVIGDQSVVLEDRVECSSQNNCPHTLQHSRAKSLCEGELEARKSVDFPDLVPFEEDIYMKKHPKLQNSSLPHTTLALQRLSLDCEVSSDANVISNQGITNIESRRSNYVSHSDRFINGLSQLKRSLSFNQESYSSKQKSGKLTYEADPDVSSLGPHSQIPHSCPLLAGAEAMMDSNLRSYNSTDIWNMKLSKLSSQSDRFDLVSTELSFSKGGNHLPPDRSFSFRLRKRLSRSFSSRESFDITQYTPMKCGPVNSEKSDSLNKNGTAPASRVKVSPLRRLLDPICKRKVAKPDEETTTNQAAAAASSSAATSFQAVLEVVTSRNGFPLFKLLVNNDNNIIIAMKASNLPQNEDAPSSSCIYTLYAGQELKKNGKWMNQCDKGKGCGFGYNAVGHLKLYLPYSPRRIQLGVGQFTVRESVLYSIENGDAGKETPKLIAGRELAAIIVKEELKGFMDCNNSKTTVLLPEKVHSLPNKGGELSPLIDRWRHGGSCDCGGWDVGCQLQILTNEDHQNSGSSTDCFITDHLHLFHQGEEVKELEEKKPMFSLAKYKEGTYMVEFSGSMSSLQACSICIAAVANQIPFCDDDSISSLNNSGHIFKGDEEPIKYVSFPPASPVERV
ncbi:uncharacterized protein LOC124920093 [Impatiens glandulifera]|uniref:uncharacterized protein LOC124920093 n=1 Tax=Impatiens glandulifera TaxID=253017 RepID=UPI001FB1940B|nr:uncharacterized protein LOC124920093 [Impatiens glandulifera]